MRKILIVHYSINNQERWGRTFPLAKSLAKFGLRVTLLTTANKNQKCLFYRIDKADGVKIVSFKDILPDKLLGKGIGFLSFISRIIHSISHKYDYVYSDCGETPNAGWPCKINQWLFKAKYISEWGDLIGQGGYFDYKPKWFRILFGTYYLWADLYFRHSADIVIVLSTFMKEYAITRGIKNESIVIVPGGAMCDVIPEIEIDKTELKFPDNILTFGYIGIDNRELQDLLPLINVLQQEKYYDKFRIFVFGKKINNEILIKYNLQDILIECGWVNYYEDQHMLQFVDIFLLIKTDSKISSAGWPNKLGDYMAIGRPVMVTPYGDIKKFISDNPKGFILISPNRESIEDQLDKILDKKYDLVKMGHTNRLIAEEKISWDSRIRDIISILDK